jgi:hypothetical protein
MGALVEVAAVVQDELDDLATVEWVLFLFAVLMLVVLDLSALCY